MAKAISGHSASENGIVMERMRSCICRLVVNSM